MPDDVRTRNFLLTVIQIEIHLVTVSTKPKFVIGKNVICAMGIVFLSSCASDVANRYYSSERYPAKHFKEVEMLPENPGRPFEILADFQARGASPKNMRKRAAKIGADAVIIQTLGGKYDMGDQWAGEDSQSKSYSRITATAIKYK